MRPTRRQGIHHNALPMAWLVWSPGREARVLGTIMDGCFTGQSGPSLEVESESGMSLMSYLETFAL